MRIEEADFILEPSLTDYDGIFDLYLPQQVNSKTNPRIEFRSAGYGMSLASCVKRICRYRAISKLNKETITLMEYMKALLESEEELKQMFNELNIRKR